MTESQIAEHQARVKKKAPLPEIVNVANGPMSVCKKDDSEKELHRMVVAYLEQHHGVIVGHARMDKKSTFTEHWPDLTFALIGKACAIELKRKGEDATDDQKKCHDIMRQNGWEVVVCDSFEKVAAFLKSKNYV